MPTSRQPLGRSAIYFGQGSRDDTIVLYYSGHGLPDDGGQLYLATRDTLTAQPDGRAIHSSEIKRVMGTSRSERQILVLDCCHSGAFGSAKGGAQVPIVAETFKTEGRGRHVLTASRSVERAYEGEREIEGVETSLFTHFLVEGLETGKAAGEGEEQVTVGALYKYARDGVTGVTSKMRPQIWISEGEGDLVIARNPNPYHVPDDLVRMVNSENRFEREGAVRILGAQLYSPEPKERAAATRVLEDLKETEENLYVAPVIKEVLEASSSANRGNRVARQIASVWGIVPVVLLLVIGALAGAVYFAPQLTAANERAKNAKKDVRVAQDMVEKRTRERDEVGAELTKMTAERDKAQAALSDVIVERNQVRARLTTVAAQRDEAGSELERVTAERDESRDELAKVTSERDEAQTAVGIMVVERTHNRGEIRDPGCCARRGARDAERRRNNHRRARRGDKRLASTGELVPRAGRPRSGRRLEVWWAGCERHGVPVSVRAQNSPWQVGDEFLRETFFWRW